MKQQHKKKKRSGAPAQQAKPAPAVTQRERGTSGWVLTIVGLVWMALAFGTGYGSAALPGACILGLGLGTLMRSFRKKAESEPTRLRDGKPNGR